LTTSIDAPPLLPLVVGLQEEEGRREVSWRVWKWDSMFFLPSKAWLFSKENERKMRRKEQEKSKRL
jgi:hypothetical protein